MSTRKAPEQVELNLAAMLDMAFQILTFFILTFKPAPVEGQIQLNMPPPQRLTQESDSAPPGVVVDPLKGLTSLPVVLTAADDGRLSRIQVAGKDVAVDPRLMLLNGKLASLLGDKASPLDQVVIQVGLKMRYDELMRVLDVCSRQKLGSGLRLSKLSIVDERRS